MPKKIQPDDFEVRALAKAALKRQFKCAVCGSPLIIGCWQDFYEYFPISLDGKLGEKEYGKDRTEGWIVECSQNYQHDACRGIPDDVIDSLADLANNGG